ncbi:MAG: [Bacteroidales bacterium]|nr:[FeFe] hydrogenase H-cluster radical SAM maturase HydG [Bacteroidales bacterium]
MYKVSSPYAEEFIDHEEISSTLEEARRESKNPSRVASILEKAALLKGLSHREAAILMDCDDPATEEKIYALASRIKHQFYGNRIVLFAPLYLSNYCVNGCVYCPYHAKNKTIPRRKLSQEEIAEEVRALIRCGHKRLAVEAGEDPVHNPLDYILESIKTIYSVREGGNSIRRVNVNIAATDVESYRKLKAAGIGTYILFQETYNKE